MIAARLYGEKDLRIEEVDIPEINENEVLLKVKSAAICGTDIRMYNNGATGVDAEHPRILGHEMSGIIYKVGSRVNKYKEGMRIAVAPNMGCGLCKQCVSGNTHRCREYRALGINEDGGFAEYVRIPEASVRQGNIAILDDSVSFDEAAVNEPFSCAYNGFLQCLVKPGEIVLVIGAGPVGILHAKLAKMAGAAKVIINDLSAERLEICKRIDSSFITVKSGNLNEVVMGLTEGKGLDVCITACSVPSVQSGALELMAIGGRINFFGGLTKERENVSINTNMVHYKQLILTGSSRANVAHYRQTLKFISDGIINVKDIISHRYTLDHIMEAINMAGKASGMKNIIFFD